MARRLILPKWIREQVTDILLTWGGTFHTSMDWTSPPGPGNDNQYHGTLNNTSQTCWFCGALVYQGLTYPGLGSCGQVRGVAAG